MVIHRCYQDNKEINNFVLLPYSVDTLAKWISKYIIIFDKMAHRRIPVCRNMMKVMRVVNFVFHISISFSQVHDDENIQRKRWLPKCLSVYSDDKPTASFWSNDSSTVIFMDMDILTYVACCVMICLSHKRPTQLEVGSKVATYIWWKNT